MKGQGERDERGGREGEGEKEREGEREIQIDDGRHLSAS